MADVAASTSAEDERNDPPEDVEAVVDAVVSAAYGRLDALDARVEHFRPEAANREDAAGVLLLLDVIEMLVAQARRWIENRHRKILEEEYARYGTQLNAVRRCINSVDAAVADNLSTLIAVPGRDFEPLIGPFNALLKRVTRRDDAELLFEATERALYRVSPDAFKRVKDHERRKQINPDLQSDGGHFNRLPPLGIVAYPSRTDGDTFQHAVVAHEVGHIALLEPSRSPKQTTVRDQAFELTEPLLAEKTTTLERNKRLRNWLDELACDLLGVRLVGPAFYFALVEFILPLQQIDHVPGTQQYQSHPSVLWRLEQLGPEVEAYLDRESGARGMRATVEAFDRFRLYVQMQERFVLEVSGEEEQERAALLVGRGHISENAERLLGGLEDGKPGGQYAREMFADDLELIWDKLDHGIAPSERVGGRTRGVSVDGSSEQAELGLEEELGEAWSTPIDWRSILNACFVYAISGASKRLHEDDDGQLSEQARRRADNLMCRGAIELSELHRRMLDGQQEFGSMEILPP